MQKRKTLLNSLTNNKIFYNKQQGIEILNALGIDEIITSPTFNIVKEYYSGEAPLFHMDVYRLDESSVEINFQEYFTKNGVSIIEWSDLIKDELPTSVAVLARCLFFN